MLIIDILTLFPQMFSGPFSESIIKRGREKGLIKINITNIRDFSRDKHKKVDDYPYGGGPGMVMKPEPVFEAVESILKQHKRDEHYQKWIILMTPQGKVFNQKKAMELAQKQHLIIICGHYEGIDERVRQFLVDEEISIGDYILTGGELPAMVVVDCVARLIPGMLGEEQSIKEESFTKGILEYPQYTRPEVYRGYRVPDILLSGNHRKISEWRRLEAIRRTFLRRPDLLDDYPLTPEEKEFLIQLSQEVKKNKSD